MRTITDAALEIPPGRFSLGRIELLEPAEPTEAAPVVRADQMLDGAARKRVAHAGSDHVRAARISVEFVARWGLASQRHVTRAVRAAKIITRVRFNASSSQPWVWSKCT
jgi:hypothetical protein